jgi:hypothetical protein
MKGLNGPDEPVKDELKPTKNSKWVNEVQEISSNNSTGNVL